MYLEKWTQAVDRHHLVKEHQKLIDRVNLLISLYEENEDREKVLLTLDQLEAAAADYFALEEAYFAASGSVYTELITAAHKSLLAQLAESASKIRSNKGRIGTEFFLFLTAWISGDIIGFDWGYGGACVQPPAVSAA